jgi:hypothetical protein
MIVSSGSLSSTRILDHLQDTRKIAETVTSANEGEKRIIRFLSCESAANLLFV